MSRTVVINIYNGRWDILDDLRLIELTDDELFAFGEHPKNAIEAAANRGQRIDVKPLTNQPTEPVDWNLL